MAPRFGQPGPPSTVSVAEKSAMDDDMSFKTANENMKTIKASKFVDVS